MRSQREAYAEKFAEYVSDGLKRAGIKQAELARKATISPQAISQIVNKKPHQLTGKLLLPERETVDKIALALGDPISVARAAAGYANSSDVIEVAETVEETLKNAQFFHAKGLSDADLEVIRPILEALDKQIERLIED